jgi:hypothetical protein
MIPAATISHAQSAWMCLAYCGALSQPLAPISSSAATFLRSSAFQQICNYLVLCLILDPMFYQFDD